VWPCPSRRCLCCDCGTSTPDKQVDTGAHGGACRAAPAPLPVQTAECLGWVRGQAYVLCSQSQQRLASSVWHVCVPGRRTFAPIKAVRWICSPNYCNKTQNARAKTIQIRRGTQWLGVAKRASRKRTGRLGRQYRMLLVDILVGPARVKQGSLPRSRVHHSFPSTRKVPRRLDSMPPGACR